jgi:acyl-CoA thioesterase I
MSTYLLKRSLVVALAATMVFIVFQIISGDDYQITNYPKDVSTIVAFGDSLVKGIGATSGNDMISLLSRETGYDIANLGRAGDTTSAALERIDEVIAINPDITIVLLGGNDYLRRVRKRETFDNLAEIVQLLQQNGSIVLVLGVRGGILRDAYSSNFETLARTKGAVLVPDILGGIIGSSDNLSDQIHPNDTGYKLMANRVAPALISLIGETE